AAGDVYQLCLTTKLRGEFTGDPLSFFLRLRREHPAPYASFIRLPDRTYASISPELFVSAHGSRIVSSPIKGTRSRSVDVARDQELMNQLGSDLKERAENLMIVDLLRNDLGKTCEPGSIRVPKLFGLESFPNVHHLVSTVTGKLRGGESPLTLLRGCFPGGSITGAPKKRAMEIIEELESCRRSLYCGSIGYISATGRMDTNIAIRTLLADAETLHCWGGGGIVADSVAENEFQETLDKIRILIQSNGD
ncbi:aminodeoxychorismate synthase component I, partial [Porticoccus sp.]